MNKHPPARSGTRVKHQADGKQKRLRSKTKKQKHVVKQLEKEVDQVLRETGSLGHTTEPIDPVTSYYFGGRKRYVGDKSTNEMNLFLTMRNQIQHAASQIGIGKEQRDGAIYLFKKQKADVVKMLMASHDHDLVARVLLYVAGQRMGRPQNITLFLPEENAAYFNKFVRKFKVPLSSVKTENAIMASANEFLSSKELPTLSKEQVIEALATNKVSKRPEVWVIIYEFARRNFARNQSRWSNHEFGVTQFDVANGFSISIQGVRNLFAEALAIFGRSRKRTAPSQREATEDETRIKVNQVLAKLRLKALDAGQVRVAMDIMPNVDRPDAWVILYHFAFGTYSFTSSKGPPFAGDITKSMVAKALGMSLMTVKNLHNQAQARLGKAARWKTLAP